ncbi:MAG: tyrosine-type recombinase/integrase [Lachnospiraceae bacterium]|nr:tyrosine-type recombinase/integrase [Lachnospiraceae bacterium]
MEFEYKDRQNKQARDKASELLADLPFYVQTFVVGREGKMSARTQYIYISRIDSFYTFLTEKNYFVGKARTDITLSDLSTLRTEDIEIFASWIRHGRLSSKNSDDKETTINNYLSAINVFFKYFVNHGKLEFNPVAGIERGKVSRHEVIRLNDRQKDEFFNCIETGDSLTKHQKAYHGKNALRDRAVCLTLARTGLRVSELVGLNLDDIDFDDCSLTVLRKGNKYDRIFFDDEVSDLLQEYLEYRKTLLTDPSEKAVFLVTIGKYKGTRLSVRAIERLVKKYAVAGSPSAGKRITPHKLRATYATDMLQATGNISLVQKALNHESPRTTMIYADERTIELQNARNILMERNRNTDNS